jgi:hypothetical protein
MSIAIGLAILVLVVAVVVGVGSRPDHFRIERSARVDAPSDVVFALINDLHEWTKWSPWEKLDPAMKKTYEGPKAGRGASYAWKGNSKAGEGRMTITESRPNEAVALDLVFLKPFPATNVTTFVLAPSEAGTNVTWSMEGRNRFMGKAMALFIDMDKLIGKDFERGLAGMNAAVRPETPPAIGAHGSRLPSASV